MFPNERQELVQIWENYKQQDAFIVILALQMYTLAVLMLCRKVPELHRKATDYNLKISIVKIVFPTDIFLHCTLSLLKLYDNVIVEIQDVELGISILMIILKLVHFTEYDIL
ncbi:hypothetical protein T10_6667 [Trichinella papuae]|uniref:Uncharacterized protein n=1 Tax=Trichinella papuae TaxID=268474 RepID=A0A0V1MGL5_9BILA|nr:hypothetical protein T10_6667 [Trichinella papuae]